MDNFLYAMTESFEKMQLEIDRVLNMTNYTEKEKNDLFLSVGTCLHSILDYADRVSIKKENEKLISAFRYANNSLKHCILVKDITEHQGGISFPIQFPLEIPKREIVWSIVDDGNKKWENQRKNYERLLKGKDVVETCHDIIDILKESQL